jgi:hypothetical protein
MSRLHLTTRIVHAASAPMVRKAGPKVAKTVQQALHFLGFLTLGCLIILIAVILHANGIPWPLIKTVAVAIPLAAAVFGVLIVLEQIRLNHVKQDPSVYEPVEPFEQRRPIDG